MGNIRIIRQGMDFTNLPQGRGNKALVDFLDMKIKAESAQDRLYTLKSTSYDFIVKFYAQPWSPNAYPGISQITYQLFSISCFQRPNPFITIDNNSDFDRLPDPKTNGGFEISSLPRQYIHNIASWQRWRIDFFSHHQDQIDWSQAENDLLPEPQITKEIIQQELKNNNIKVTPTQELHKLILLNGPGAKEACIDRIGTEICLANYYIEEKKLSSREQQRRRSLRKIFSIIRDGHKQYISLDFEKGVFEFFNEYGIHQGEYYFNGSFIEGSIRKDVDHQLHFE